MTEYRNIVPVNIDFDESHNEWMSNKRKLANGMYRYICCGITKSGKKCLRTPEENGNMCGIHRTKPRPTSKKTSLISQIYMFIRPKIKSMHNNSPLIPILDVFDETILVRCDPPLSCLFTQLYEMMDYYQSITHITDVYIPYAGEPNDISHLLLCLQLILSFLDGMEELTKMETTKPNIKSMKMRILDFNGYIANEYMHTTSSKWKHTSDIIKENIIRIMLNIFEHLEE